MSIGSCPDRLLDRENDRKKKLCGCYVLNDGLSAPLDDRFTNAIESMFGSAG